MKLFFKCSLSALAVSALVGLALLSSGCKNDKEKPSTGGDITGTWHIEFFEEEYGGYCIADNSFDEGGKGTTKIVYDGGEETTFPILWRVEGTDKLCFILEEDKEMYEELGLEWPSVKFLVSGETLKYIYDNEVVTFVRSN